VAVRWLNHACTKVNDPWYKHGSTANNDDDDDDKQTFQDTQLTNGTRGAAVTVIQVRFR